VKKRNAFKLHTADAAFPGAVGVAVLYREHAAKAGINIKIVKEAKDGYWSDVWMKKERCFSYWWDDPQKIGCSQRLMRPIQTGMGDSGKTIASIDLGYQELSEGYVSKYHLCLDIRKYLVSIGYYAELQPRKFYEQLK
jgi:hypothetical protein